MDVLFRRAQKLRNDLENVMEAIESLQKLCTHDAGWKETNHDTHRTEYTCKVCNAKRYE